jgi:hypothetical protein
VNHADKATIAAASEVKAGEADKESCSCHSAVRHGSNRNWPQKGGTNFEFFGEYFAGAERVPEVIDANEVTAQSS